MREVLTMKTVAEYYPLENFIFLLKIFLVIHCDICPCHGRICVETCTLWPQCQLVNRWNLVSQYLVLILFFLTCELCRGEKMSEFPFHRKFKYFNIWFCPKNSDERKKFWKKFCFEHVKKMQLIWHYHASASSSTMPPGSRNFHGLSHHSSWTGSFEEATSALMFILMTGALSVWLDTSSLR